MKDFEIRCDESHLEKNHTLYGKFTLGPFLPGQGTTFGNALRRSLLAELSGLGITAFEILGVMHEFSTLPGLRESVLDLSLNLKQIVLTGILPCSAPPLGFLKVRGPAIIKAADLKLPPGVYCASPEQYIATLASNGILHVKFVVSVGKGHFTQPYSLYRSLSKVKVQPTLCFNYVKNERRHFSEHGDIDPLGIKSSQRVTENAHVKTIDSLNKKMAKGGLENPNLDRDFSTFYEPDKEEQKSHNLLKSSSTYVDNADVTHSNSPGYVNIQKQIFQRVNPHQVLPIDTVFTPVSKVNFSTQVNDRLETSRENIVLEIWTNGSIHPKRALEEATLSLVQNFTGLLKNIQQASSFYKGLRYWNYLQPSSITPRGAATHADGSKNFSQLLSTNVDNTFHNNKQKNNIKNNQFSLDQAIYNLDIGNLDLSLQTFIQLKKAKINTLSNLVNKNKFFSQEKNVFLNEKIVNEIKNVANQFGINLPL